LRNSSLKFHDCGDWCPISFLSSSKKPPRDQKFLARGDEDGNPDKWPDCLSEKFHPGGVPSGFLLCSSSPLPPSPPAEKATARKDLVKRRHRHGSEARASRAVRSPGHRALPDAGMERRHCLRVARICPAELKPMASRNRSSSYGLPLSSAKPARRRGSGAGHAASRSKRSTPARTSRQHAIRTNNPLERILT
jgi:hypothetical protein